MLIGLYSCTCKTNKSNEPEFADTIQPFPKTLRVIDTLRIIPERIIQNEYNKSKSAYSYHSMLKKDFPFDGWLTEIKDRDSIQKISSEIDSLMFKLSEKRKSALNLSDEWHLKYFINRGWYEIGLDRTNVNRSYISKTNKFRLRGTDLFEIFKLTEGWVANLISENELIIRYGYFYPNGNQTSWDYQNIYIFTKSHTQKNAI